MVSAEVITVEDGDSFDQIEVTAGRELVVNGGHVETVNNLGSVVTINGGRVESTVTDEFNDENGGHTPKSVITGYDQQFGQWQNSGPVIENLGSADAEIHGYNFRVYVDPGSSQSSTVNGVGWLLDGTIVDFKLTFRNARNLNDWQSATLVKHDPVFVDPTGDWNFDLSDLNVIRNNFGSSGEQADGDTNFDGLIDLADLNLVRNKFGLGYGLWPPEWEYSGDVPSYVRHRWTPDMPIPVPEPSTFFLAATALFGLAGIPLRRRCLWPSR